jgi:hypothetical protein
MLEAALLALECPQVVELEVDIANTSAISFYRHCGFDATGTVRRCGDDSAIPAQIMRRINPTRKHR